MSLITKLAQVRSGRDECRYPPREVSTCRNFVRRNAPHADHAEAERWVTDHWLYFYECSVGCIGVLKDWLLRAVSAALDDGAGRLSLDCVQDYALHVDIYRQMTLDAYEGEQRLNHTEANREHVWRLLQGGELIPKRSRKKKVTDEADSRVEMEVKISSDSSALQVSTEADAVSASAKPKRTRRIREPKPKRYPVGEPDPERGM